MADADPGKPPPEFMSALVTEHFVLQGTSSATVSESGSRVSIYLSALSSGLASMVIVVNSVVGGAALALVAALAVHAAAPVPIAVGLCGGVILLALGLRYEHGRLIPVVLSRAMPPDE
jgi:hypothetical protein